MSSDPQPNFIERHRAHFLALREADSTIRMYEKKIDTCEAQIADQKNRATAARSAIRARERGLMAKATKLIQKETGVRTFPGMRCPQELADAYRREVMEREKNAREEATKALYEDQPS